MSNHKPTQQTHTPNPTQIIHDQLSTYHVITLLFPFKDGMGEMVSTVKMRRCKVGDLRAVSHLKNEMEQELVLFARLTGLVPEDMDLLDTADYKQLQNTFRSFTPAQRDEDESELARDAQRSHR